MEILTVIELLSFKGLETRADSRPHRSVQREPAPPPSAGVQAQVGEAGTEAVSASTHLRSYRKGYNERHEGAGKSCR